MNKYLAALLILALGLTARAETFTVDTDHAVIGFAVKHMMVSNTKGTFNTFEGTVEFDIESGSLISIQGSINAGSIDTNNEGRDKHLKDEDFFHVDKFPEITFQSTAVKATGDNTYEVTGMLNILGVDREVVIPVTVTGPVDDPWGNKRIGLETSTVLNRRDLGITESPSAMIGDEVKVMIEAEATYK